MCSPNGAASNALNQDIFNSTAELIGTGSGSVLSESSSRLSGFSALLCTDTERLLSTADNMERLMQGISLDLDQCQWKEKDQAMELTDHERNQIAEIYEMVRSTSDKCTIEELLLSHKHLLDMEISIMAFVDCQCMGKFERPRRTQPVCEYSDWIRRGRCHCVGTPNQRVSLRFLHIAAALGDVWLTNILLDQECEVCALTQYFHHTALHLAVYHFQIEVVEALVKRASSKLKTTDNSGLLQLVITERPDKCLSLLKCLIKSGICDPNEWDEINERSLSMAIDGGDTGSVELLLHLGADPNLPNCCGKPMLNLAINSGSWSCIKALISAGADVNASCKELGLTGLLCALSSEFLDFSPVVPLDIIKLLLEKGADPNAVSVDGHFCIDFASEIPNIEYAKLLLVHGADVNRTDTAGNGFSALHSAAASGKLDFLKLFLDHGAFPDILTIDRFTPLSLAAKNNYIDCVKTLLKHPVNVNNYDESGDTPLHAMAFLGNKEGVMALLDHGANPDIANVYRATPLWNAVYMGHTEIVHILALKNVTLEICSEGRDHFLYDNYNCFKLYSQQHSTLWVAVDRQFSSIANFLVEIGYKICKDDWLLYGDNCYESMSHRGLKELIEKLQEAAHIVPSLRSQCRRYFRDNYRGRLLPSVISQCPLPVSLKDYILLKDVPCPLPD